MPATMVGTPAIAVTTTRTARVKRPPTSLRNTAVATAAGAAIATPSPTSSSVPTMAWLTPPKFFGSETRTPFWSWVNRCHEARWAPLLMTKPRVATIAARTPIIALAMTTETTRSVATCRVCSSAVVSQ